MGIAIGCGLGAALCFGVGDFLAQRLTHRHGWMPAMFAVQVASVVALVVLGLVDAGKLATATPAQLGGVAVVGVINTLGMIGLYRAFEVGKLALVSPIAGSTGAFTVAFAWLAGRTPAASVVPALLAVIVGVVVASVVVEPSEARAPAKLGRALGVGWALLAALAFGWVFLEIGPSSVALGQAWTLALLRAVAIVALLGLARPARARLAAALRADPDSPRSRGRVLVVALLDSGGMLLLAYGSSRGLVAGESSIVAVLSSSFPIVTIALARICLDEALRWWQWLGIALVLAGVAGVSAGS